MGKPRNAESVPKQQTRKHANIQRSPYKVERVGGGYSVQAESAEAESAAMPDTVLASIETVNVLPADGPYSDFDLSIIAEIVRLAEETAMQDYEAGRGSKEITLVRLLQAYEVVLPAHSIVPQEDVFYYRLLLKLSLDPNPDWWFKLEQQRADYDRNVNSIQSSRRSNKVPAAAAADQGTNTAGRKPRKSNRASSNGCLQQLGLNATAAAVLSRSNGTALDATSGCASPAIEAAAAAVDAASTAIAAALAEAQACSAVSNTVTAAGSAHTSFLPHQQQQLAAAADQWMSVSHSLHKCGLHSAAGSTLNRNHHVDWPSEQVQTAAELTGSMQAKQLTSLSPVQGTSGLIRARSLSPNSSSRNAAFAALGGCSSARRRSRSASPQRNTTKAKADRVDSQYCTPRKGTECGAHSYSLYSAAGYGDFRPPTAADYLVQPAGYSSASLLTAAKQQHSREEGAFGKNATAAASKCSSPWRADMAASYLSDLELDRYIRFSRQMSQRHSWSQQHLAALAARDVQAAAEQRWRLAMSFWEVHCAWRCFIRWRQWAALSAEENSVGYRHWLLLCSFRWWMSMVKHYRRNRELAVQQQLQQQPSVAVAGTAVHDAGSSCSPWLDQHGSTGQQAADRPSSPLTGISRLLQQQPHLRPPSTAAAALRQHPSGRMLAGCIMSAWQRLVQQRREIAHVQSLIAWHHIQHVQSSVWSKWRTAFEQQTPHHKLMRTIYQSRRHSTLRRVLKHWRSWAPAKRAKRRKLQDTQAMLSKNERRRIWKALLEYTARRKVSNRQKQQAQQHHRQASLQRHLVQWAHILDITEAFEQLADDLYQALLTRRAAAMLAWWRTWVQLRQEKDQLQLETWQHMQRFTATRCMTAWQWQVLRRQQLQELQQRGQYISAKFAGKLAFRAWHKRTELVKHHQDTMLAIVTNLLRRQLAMAWRTWRAYTLQKRQQHEDLAELSQLDAKRIWQENFTTWCDALRRRVKVVQVAQTLQGNMLRRCVQHWKAWVDQKVDWRNFQAEVLQRMLRTRLGAVLRQWHVVAVRMADTRDLLANFLQHRRQRQLQLYFGTWHTYLALRVTKRMNQLSALLHWEQSLVRKALMIWVHRSSMWKYKRMRRLRADSYRALRLLDLALTAWTSVWVEGQELAQKATFFLVGRQAELKVLVMRAWGEEAARLKLKRERMEIAGLHSKLTCQQQVVAAWRAETSHCIRLRSVLTGCMQRWSHLLLSRAFEQWKSWALYRAVLQRKAKAVISLLAGRTLHWSFCMLRENALRKRRTRSARHSYQRWLATLILQAWRQLLSDAKTFRGVVQSVGQQMRLGLLAAALDGWRDVVRVKQWQAAGMMRALMCWGGNRKKLCFQVWRQWAALKQGKQDSLHKALHHWQHKYLSQAFAGWRVFTQRAQVGRHALERFLYRRLRIAFDAWRAWQQRKQYLAAVFARLQGKGHQQLLRVVWNAWRAFVPSSQISRQVKDRAELFWQRRLLAVCFFTWQDYVAAQARRQQQLVSVLLHWEKRLVGSAFRAWRQKAQVQVYNRHVLDVISSKLSNGLLFKSFTSWRDLVLMKHLLRERAAVARQSWATKQIRVAFIQWRRIAHEERFARKVQLHQQHRLLYQAFTGWREEVLVRQQDEIIVQMVGNRRRKHLLLQAWTAWREVIDQYHQVAGRLRNVAQHLQYADLARTWDGWREIVQLHRMAVAVDAQWKAGVVARCFRSWRLWAAQKHSLAVKVAAAREVAARRLASCILQQWADLAWELPRERKAAASQDLWLQHRALWGWHEWVQLRVRWRQFDSAVVAHWTNLHLSAAWRAWRGWVQQKQQKKQAVDAVARRWCNLHLAAAFQAWWEYVQVTQHQKVVLETVAGRWRNLHTAAAFGAWRSYVKQHRERRAVQNAVAARWNNLHLALAFGAWREATVSAAERIAAAGALAGRIKLELVAEVFLSWQEIAARRMAVRGKHQHLAERQRLLQLRKAWQGWLDHIAWQHAKQEAVLHWRQNVLQSLLNLWRSHTQRKQRYAQNVRLLLSRSELQLLRCSFTTWRTYTTYKLQKAAADEYSASRRQQQVLVAWVQLTAKGRSAATAAHGMAARLQARSRSQLLQASIDGWRQYVMYRKQKAAADEYAAATLLQKAFLGWLRLANEARYKESIAANMAAGVVARSEALLLCSCFDAWHNRAIHSKHVKEILLKFTIRRLRSYLFAWKDYTHRLAGASHLLRTLLASTLRGAFCEWRIIATEQAHWRRVQLQLVEFIQLDDTGVAHRAHTAALHWYHWPLSAAFATWRANVQEQALERSNERRASTFLYYALTIKALTGFKFAVQNARLEAAAGAHKQGATKRQVLRAWRTAAVYCKEKRQKTIAAVFTYTSRLQRSAFIAWLLYLQHRQQKVQLWARAARHYVLRRKAGCLGAWLKVAHYLAPLRKNIGHLHSKRQQQTMRQVLAAWQLQCRRSYALHQALGRLAHKTLGEAFTAWKDAALYRARRRSLLHRAFVHMGQRQLSLAFNRWREAAQQLQQLRAKAQIVLARTLQRQLSSAWQLWRSYVAYRSWKYEQLAKAVAHCHRQYSAGAVAAWKMFVEEARRFQRLSEQLLAVRQQKQQRVMMHWWHLLAQDLHHHRVVLASYRARRIRREGYAVMAFWREWAHERSQERKAIVSYWNRLLVTAFGAWLMVHEEALTDKADTHYAARLAARTMADWQLFMALMHRKRVLSAAAKQLHATWCLRRGLRSWMVFAYYKHMGHVALHFRIRRLACIVLQEWHEAAQERAQLQQTYLEITHQLAVRTATSLLTHWQQVTAAQQHHRQRRQKRCWGVWVYWSARHKVKSRVLRAAVQQLHAKLLERCFYSWRWYCQVRVMRNVAFQHKQRAIREALAIGEQVARLRRRALLAATFMAWHVQVSKYRKVAEKLASLLHHNLTTCFRAWRDASDHARTAMLRAERHAATTLLQKLLPAWLELAQDMKEQRQQAQAAADRFYRRSKAGLVLQGWRDEIQMVHEQREGLWHVMLLLLQHERTVLLHDTLQAWHHQAQQQVALRACIANFVNKRRLECLSEFLTLWHQYTAAMRTEGEALVPALAAASPAAFDEHFSRTPAVAQSLQLPRTAVPGSPAYYSVQPISSSKRSGRGLDGAASTSMLAALYSPGEHAASAVPEIELPAGLLPVTGGPSSPLLGPRSAHQDRHLARRMAAMSGGAPEVDPGSDDEQSLFAGLPATLAAAAAAERQDRQQPLLALSRGYRQHRATLNDDRTEYDDAEEGNGSASPGFDLHSVAESMRQAHEQGLSPWQLPSVRAPRQKAHHPTTLSLDDLHGYQQQYPYHLHQQQQGPVQQYRSNVQYSQHGSSNAKQRKGSTAKFIGSPVRASAAADYQPLLEQQLRLHQQQVELCEWQLEQRHREGQRTPSPARQQPVALQQSHQQQEPWFDSGKPREHYTATSPNGKAADTHWSAKRGHILGEYTATSGSNGSSSRSSSPSIASAAAGSQNATELQLQAEQEQQLHENLYGRWANKASPQQQKLQQWQRQQQWGTGTVNTPSPAPSMPSFAGSAVPRNLAALVSPVRIRRNTASSPGGTCHGTPPVTPAPRGRMCSVGAVSSPGAAEQRRVQQQRQSAAKQDRNAGGDARGQRFSLGCCSYIGQY